MSDVLSVSRSEVAAAVAAMLPASELREIVREEARKLVDVVPLVDEVGNEGLALLQAATVAQAKASARKYGIRVRTLGRKKAYILRSEVNAALAGTGLPVSAVVQRVANFPGSNEHGAASVMWGGVDASAARGKSARGGIQLRKGDRV